jgi:hypothetical protein
MILLLAVLLSKAWKSRYGTAFSRMQVKNQIGLRGRIRSLSSVLSPSFLTDLVTWIGINDINRWMDPQAQMTLLFQLQEDLYEAGARNFVYFKVPPFDRSPQGNLPLKCD